jgi:hypothetical protein
MTHHHPYVVLLPDRAGNPSGKYLVVHVKEWVAITLGEKENYVYSKGYDDYLQAADERNHRNHMSQGGSWNPTGELPRRGVRLIRTTPRTEKAQA